MIKKESLAALVLFLLIPVVLLLGGALFSLINPEIAASHPNYPRNFHLLMMLKVSAFLGAAAIAAVLWLLVCLLVIRSKKRSWFWIFLAALGPIGFAIIAMLNDSDASQPDIYTRFLRRMRWYIRVPYELCLFAVVWSLAWELMLLKRNLMIWIQAAATGASTAQIISIQNTSSGMWAFGESLEVIFLAVLLYLLWPLAFRLIGYLAVKRSVTAPNP